MFSTILGVCSLMVFAMISVYVAKKIVSNTVR